MKQESSVDMLSKLWETSSKEKKIELLKSCNLNVNWSETKTIKELVRRGGGFVAKELHKLVKIWQTKNPDKDVMFI